MTDPTSVPRLLLVDDDATGRRLLARLLRDEGFDVAEAGTASEAARMLSDRPDLVLLDVVLSDGDGHEVCRRIKSDPGTAFTPVLMVSGEAIAPHDRAVGLEGGADAYLTKPIEPEVLIAQVRALLRARRAEVALRAAERRFRAVIDRSVEAVEFLSEDGTVLYASPSVERVGGRTAEEVVGRSFLEWVPADDRAATAESYVALIRSPGASATARHRYVHRDGSERWAETTGTNLLHDPDVRAVVLNFHDVTDRKRAEDELLMRDRAIRAVSQGILITDANAPDHPIVYASPGFERLTGYPAAEVIGRNPRLLQGPDTDARVAAEADAAVREGREFSAEILNYRKDGTPFWNAVHSTPVRDEAGRITHSVCVQVDVTERRRMEAHLREARKMEAVGQLAGGIAHDFNNLLTIINGYSELLLAASPTDGPAPAYLSAIHDAGSRAASLTGQLLAFSRRSVLEPKILDPNAVIAETGQTLRRLIGEDVTLTLALGPRVGRVRVDPGRISQVLMNLAVNARDAIPTGGMLTVETRDVTLDATYARRRPDVVPGRYVLIAVTDTGHGMDADTQAKAFEPFFTTKEVGKGTGLGLATVYGIVRMSNGYVEVYSEVGRGTTFKIYLPTVDGEPGPAEEEKVPRARGGSESVLLVEDQDEVRGIAALALRGQGYHVHEAADGAAALRAVAQMSGPPDLLVTDVVMPGMSGRLLAEELRATYPAVRVLYTSGYTDDAVVRHGILQADVAFLRKPFMPSELARKVREVLDQ